MISENKLEFFLGVLLQAGIILTMILVLTGGIWFLWQHGFDSFQHNIIFTTSFDIDIIKIWQEQNLSSPVKLIELGLLTLVLTQIARVAVLCAYYLSTRDYWFILFSFFILSILLYSLVYQA